MPQIRPIGLVDLERSQKAIERYQNAGLSKFEIEQRKNPGIIPRSSAIMASCGNEVTQEEIIAAMEITGCTYKGILARLYSEKDQPGWPKKQALTQRRHTHLVK